MMQKSTLGKSQCFVYSTLKIADEATDSSVRMTVFTLTSVLHMQYQQKRGRQHTGKQKRARMFVYFSDFVPVAC